ncbi:dihydroorotase [Natronospora cellulosivora (SeqCode)]
MKILIKNANIIDPINNLRGKHDLMIVNGKIEKIATEISVEEIIKEEYKIVDLEGKYLLPGLIDMHTHLREPGYEDKETIKSGCEAAAAGGFTTIACMPNTKPVADNAATVEYIKSKAENALVKVIPIGSITKKSEGKELAEIGFLKEAGVRALSDDGYPVMNSEIMRRAMEYSGSFDLPIISHCEDIDLVAEGVMNEGYNSTILGLKGIPAAAEEIMISRDIILAEFTGAQLHIAHISTKRGLDMLAEAKKKGVKVSAETTPHHLVLSDDAVKGYNPDTKVNPPLRSEEDIQALREGIKSGIIEVIATDHAPHTYEDKLGEYNYAAFGISGFETAISLLYSNLIAKDIISFEDLVLLMGKNPARILGLDYPGIKENAIADLIVFDDKNKWKLEKKNMKSKGKNTPFAGQEMQGKVILTIVDGKIVYNDMKGKGELCYG